ERAGAGPRPQVEQAAGIVSSTVGSTGGGARDPVERRRPVVAQHLAVQVEQAGHGVVRGTGVVVGAGGVVMGVRAVGVLAGGHGGTLTALCGIGTISLPKSQTAPGGPAAGGGALSRERVSRTRSEINGPHQNGCGLPSSLHVTSPGLGGAGGLPQRGCGLPALLT